MYNVSGMSHNEMVDLVRRRLNKLAMCKRGSVSSDINAMIEKLGNKPSYTRSERAKLTLGIAAKIRKAMTPPLSMIKKSYSLHDVSSQMLKRGKDAEKFFHELVAHVGDKCDEILLGLTDNPIKELRDLKEMEWAHTLRLQRSRK